MTLLRSFLVGHCRNWQPDSFELLDQLRERDPFRMREMDRPHRFSPTPMGFRCTACGFEIDAQGNPLTKSDEPLASIYLAHALSAPTPAEMDANRLRAATWAAWISVTFRVAVSADWIWLSSRLAETHENRAWGLACDKAQISRCNELWMVGHRVSGGMTIEAQHAQACGKRVFDLTGLPMDAALIVRAIAEQLAHQQTLVAVGCDPLTEDP